MTRSLSDTSSHQRWPANERCHPPSFHLKVAPLHSSSKQRTKREGMARVARDRSGAPRATKAAARKLATHCCHSLRREHTSYAVENSNVRATRKGVGRPVFSLQPRTTLQESSPTTTQRRNNHAAAQRCHHTAEREHAWPSTEPPSPSCRLELRAERQTAARRPTGTTCSCPCSLRGRTLETACGSTQHCQPVAGHQ